MKMRDARALSPKELEDRRKQAIKLRKTGMKYSDIGDIVGVNRNTVSKWCKLWEEKGAKGLRVKTAGRQKGSGSRLDIEQQRKVRTCLIRSTPEQMLLISPFGPVLQFNC